MNTTTASSVLDKSNWFLILVLIIEGGAIMAVELIGAKLIAPYYGNSLYVWAAVLATTLGALTIGYYSGGNLSSTKANIKTLLTITSSSALFVLFMPIVSSLIMEATLGMELRIGILTSCIIFLMPPLIAFGMVGPMIVRLATNNVKHVGKIAGTVYFTSTIGGVASTFLFGFYCIPFLGLKVSCYITGTALAVLPLFYLIYIKLKNKNF